MLLEDWIVIGLFSGVALIYLITKAVEFWAKYQLQKTQLESAIANLRTGYKVTRKFTKIIADVEMTGKKQTVVVSSEFAEAMYKVEKHLKESLELLDPTDSLT